MRNTKIRAKKVFATFDYLDQIGDFQFPTRFLMALMVQMKKKDDEKILAQQNKIKIYPPPSFPIWLTLSSTAD